MTERDFDTLAQLRASGEGMLLAPDSIVNPIPVRFATEQPLQGGISFDVLHQEMASGEGMPEPPNSIIPA